MPSPVAAFRAGTIDRRTVFRGAGLVALLGGGGLALAACSGSDTAGPAATTPAGTGNAGGADTSPSAAASSAGPSDSASASSSASASASASSGPTADAAHTVAKSKVPEGGGTIGSDFVVTQPSAGTYKAYSNVCTHLGCQLTKVADGTMDCPCHRSKFSITDGSVVSGPAPRPLPSKSVVQSGSNLLIGT